MIRSQQSTFWLGLSFATVLFMMAGLAIFSMYKLNDTNKHMDTIAGELLEKISLTITMRRAARERTVNLQHLIILEDAFDKDDVWMTFNSHGGEFANARMTLIDMSQSQVEKDLIRRQGEATSQNVDIQMEIALLALEGKNDQATQLLIDRAIPIQIDVFNVLDELYKHYSSLLAEKKRTAEQAFISTYQISWIVGSITILLGFLIAYLSIKRTTLIQSQLAEKQLQLTNNQQQLQMAMDASKSGLWDWDIKNNIIFYNSRWREMFAYEKDQDLSDLFFWQTNIHHDDAKAVNEKLQAHLERLTNVCSAEYRLRDNNGNWIWVIGAAKATEFNLIGRPTRIVGTHTDITIRKNMEDELRRSQKMDSIGQLSGGIAHDFNNQLGVVIGYLDMINDRIPDTDVKYKKWIQTASKATQRCINLTSQLLTLSRHQPNEIKNVNLSESISSMKNIFERSVTPEVHIRYLLPEDLWECSLDEAEFQDALLNIVLNARDAMPDGGEIVLEATNTILTHQNLPNTHEMTAGEYIKFVIHDTGCGMDNDLIEKAFEPFFTTKEVGKGTGLGLSMVYAFVKRYDSFIQIYSEENKGTTFTIYFPRTSTEETITDNNTENTTKILMGKETILIVDDEKDLLDIAKQLLEELGYKTYTADTALKAVELFQQHDDIDMLFSDIVMPGGISGYDLADKAENIQPGIKILLTTGFSSDSTQSNPKLSILNKPYRKDTLSIKVREILDQKLQ